MIVRSINYLARDDRQIVFGIIGQVIFAFAPLTDVAAVGCAHDRAPGDVPAAVSCVVLRSIRAAIVT